MGCKYACTCVANCLKCSQYEPESYFGEAEDILAQTKGFASDDEWRYHQQMERQQEEEYNRQMELLLEEEYNKRMEEYYNYLEQKGENNGNTKM